MAINKANIYEIIMKNKVLEVKNRRREQNYDYLVFF